MGQRHRQSNVLMPDYEESTVKDVQWDDLRCGECQRKIGEKAPGTKGRIRLLCKRCKKITPYTFI